MEYLYLIILFSLINNIFSDNVKEIRIDLRESAKDKEGLEKTKKDIQLNHKFNLATPYSEEYFKLMKELFYNQIGENSIVSKQ